VKKNPKTPGFDSAAEARKHSKLRAQYRREVEREVESRRPELVFPHGTCIMPPKLDAEDRRLIRKADANAIDDDYRAYRAQVRAVAHVEIYLRPDGRRLAKLHINPATCLEEMSELASSARRGTYLCLIVGYVRDVQTAFGFIPVWVGESFVWEGRADGGVTKERSGRGDYYE
jgi:hypothetical protein